MTFPFGQRTAEMLMAIANHPILSNPKFVSNLPPSWGTLYEMTRLPEQELETLIENGTINADIRRCDVEAIADEVRDDGLYKFDHVPEFLDRLVPFMKKWPEPPHGHCYGLCGGTGRGEHAVDTTELGQLLVWIEKLHQLCVEEETTQHIRNTTRNSAIVGRTRVLRHPPTISPVGRSQK